MEGSENGLGLKKNLWNEKGVKLEKLSLVKE